MILQIVDNTVKFDRKNEYIAAANDFALDSTKNEEGCLGMEVWLDNERDDHVYIISRWTTLDAMKTASLFLKYKPRLKPCFISNDTTILSNEEKGK